MINNQYYYYWQKKIGYIIHTCTQAQIKRKRSQKNDKTLVQVYSANENSKKHNNNYNKHNAKKKYERKN